MKTIRLHAVWSIILKGNTPDNRSDQVDMPFNSSN